MWNAGFLGLGAGIFGLKQILSLTLLLLGSICVAEDAFEDLNVNSSRADLLPEAQLPAQTRPIQARWKSELAGRRYHDGVVDRDGVRFRLLTAGRYQPQERLWIDAEVSFDLFSENVQSIFDETDQKNGVYLREAVVVGQPAQWAQFKAGAINQEFLSAPLLVGDKTFPGIAEHFSTWSTDRRHSAQLIFQQAVPTSSELGTRSTDDEPTPYFLTSTLAGLTEVSRLQIAAHTTYFHYSRLPSQVAQRSQLIGNEVDVATPTGDEFRHRFAGLETGLGLLWQVSDTSAVELGASYLQNMRAPNDINKGQWVRLGGRLDGIKGLRLLPGVGYFVNQSDSSPAFYNSYAFGHNNRYGSFVELKAQWPNSGIWAGIKYLNSHSINARPFEPQQNYFMISLGTDYADI